MLKVADDPMVVSLMGLVASTAGDTPGSSGWRVNSPAKVTGVPAFTLMHGLSYTLPSIAPPKLMVTAAMPVRSSSLPRSQPLTLVPPPPPPVPDAVLDDVEVLEVPVVADVLP